MQHFHSCVRFAFSPLASACYHVVLNETFATSMLFCKVHSLESAVIFVLMSAGQRTGMPPGGGAFAVGPRGPTSRPPVPAQNKAAEVCGWSS